MLSFKPFQIRRLATIFLILSLSASRGQTFPGGFSQTKVGTVYYPTSMAKAPDGRLFITEKGGKVKIFKNGAILGTPFLEVAVEQTNERGLSSIAIDPDFNTNHYVYIYYTVPSPVHNRLSRFVANGDVVLANSETILIEFENVVNSIHNGGGIAFGPDGKLYLSIGDDKISANAQDLSNHKGKILRINKDGTAASGNPFSGSTAASRIWGYGFRNPFSLSIQPGTGKIFVNDVGESNWEEINNATVAGKNFGWPYSEGNSNNTAYTNAVHAYHHTNGDYNLTGCAVSGGAFFSPSNTNYPSMYVGKYFFVDYCNKWMNYLDPSTGAVTNFASNLPGAPIGVCTGADGNIYYMSISMNGLYKISYNGGSAPVITQQPDNESVSQGQQARFTVGASGAQPLYYQWKKNGVNISGANSATYTIPSAQTSDAGQYKVTVSNSSGTVTSNTVSLTVTGFNSKPVASIINPASPAMYRAGDTIYFSGTASDQEDGSLAASSFSWTVEFHHDVHIHPGPNIPPGVKTGSFFIPFTGESSANVYYRLVLVVKDSQNGIDTVTRDIRPHTSQMTFKTMAPGLQVALEGQPRTTTFSVTGVERMRFALEAPSPQTKGDSVYTFSSWSHGGARSQTISVPAENATYTAVYTSAVSSNTGCTASGSILREYWSNVTSSVLSDIPFNTPPTGSSQLTKFEGPTNFGDNYGSRIRGYICPPATGNYTFWIASDNSSELWLSTNSDPANKVKIAYVSGYNMPREWTKYTGQQSSAVYLESGKKYYIEAIHREKAEGDNLAVGWALPGGVMERPIPGNRLSPYSAGMEVTLTSPANNAAFTSGSNISLAASVSGATNIQKVEFYSGANKLGEDASAPYTYTWNAVPQGNYQLTAKAIGSATAVSQAVNITVSDGSGQGCTAAGYIIREVWNNIAGGSVSSIPITTNPTYTAQLTQFKIPSNTADNYGDRIRGFICAPVTGNYTLWIASDDNSELWLSTDANPANKQKIAYVTGYTGSQEYTKYASQKSAPVNLVAGEKYYIEALHKEGSQGDNLAVGWQLPDGTLERPIPGNRLSPFSAPLTVSVTAPANNSSYGANSNIVINASASGGNPISKVSFYAGTTRLGEDLSAPYSFTWTNVQPGTYAITAKATDNTSATAVSQAVNVQVGNLASCTGTGGITREVWLNATGTSVSNIPLSTAPSTKNQLTSLMSPQDIGDNYGQRIRGYVCPPVSGTYEFYIASDDNSELWLSTSDQPSAKQLIASVTGWTFPSEWTKYTSQKSAGVTLTAGQKYYIEVLHKEGTQGDHVEVGWTLPNSTMERPIPGNRLVPYETVSSSVCEASVQPGGSTTFCQGGSVTLYANTGAGYLYQWKKDGVNISGATNSSYVASTQGQYQVKISFTGCTAWSAPVNVTVNDFLTARITPGGPTTFCNGGSVTLYGNRCDGYIYQWKKNDVDIPGANSPDYVATTSGSYQLKIISGSSINWSALVEVTVNNCSSKTMANTDTLSTESVKEEKAAVTESASIQNAIANETFKLKVFPNPTTGMFSFDYCIEEMKHEMVEIKVLNASTGQMVYHKPAELTSGCVKANIGLSGDLPIGIYVLQLRIGEKTESTKLVLYR